MRRYLTCILSLLLILALLFCLGSCTDSEQEGEESSAESIELNDPTVVTDNSANTRSNEDTSDAQSNGSQLPSGNIPSGDGFAEDTASDIF